MAPMTEARDQSLGEEIANAISHGIGFLLAIASVPLLSVHAARLGTVRDIVAACVFAATMVLLYGISTLYHALPIGRGWALFALVWAIAAVGVTAKLLNRLRHPYWSTGLYVAMGWVVLIAIKPLVERIDSAGLAWLVAGGVAYTLGALVFLLDHRIRYAHFVWHLFVLLGSICHFFAAFWYAR